MKQIGFYQKIVLMLIVLFLFNCDRVRETEHHYHVGDGEYYGEYYPTDSWRTCSPEAVGMDSKKLEIVYDYAANQNIHTDGLLIVKKGYIVLEEYFRDFTKNSRHESYSVAKSFTNALIGIALEKGLIGSIDERISKYYPELKKPDVDIRKKGITIKNLLSMMSGLTWQEEGEFSHSEDDAFLMMDHDDYIKYVLDKPMRYNPGSKWYYSSGDTMLLSGILEKSTGMSAFYFAKENLFSHIGLPDIEWAADPLGHTITPWGIQGTLKEFAKFGFLYLNKGKWDGEQVVSEKWIDESLKPVFPPEIYFYGYQWWLGSSFENYKAYDLPDDIFLAWGLYTQLVFVIPSHDLVIVRLGMDPYSSSDQWDEAEFISLVLNAEK